MAANSMGIRGSKTWFNWGKKLKQARVSPYYHAFLREVGESAKGWLKAEAEASGIEKLTGGINRSIKAKHGGGGGGGGGGTRSTMSVGLFIKDGNATTQAQNPAIYIPSIIFGWQASATGIDEDGLERMLHWAMARGLSPSEANRYVYNIVRKWQRVPNRQGRNFIIKVLNLDSKSERIADRFVGKYGAAVDQMQEEHLADAKTALMPHTKARRPRKRG